VAIGRDERIKKRLKAMFKADHRQKPRRWLPTPEARGMSQDA
jgi:hypothetical protein